MIIKLDRNTSDIVNKSATSEGRTREVSAFTAEVKALGLQRGEYGYVSHKYWLKSLGEKAQKLTPASIRNGCRYSLKAQGFDCKAILLSGKNLDMVAKSEGIELTENDRIYSITVSEKI